MQRLQRILKKTQIFSNTYFLDHGTDIFLYIIIPDVFILQVSEWYREGVCGGGYYRLRVRLMGEDGKV